MKGEKRHSHESAQPRRNENEDGLYTLIKGASAKFCVRYKLTA